MAEKESDFMVHESRLEFCKSNFGEDHIKNAEILSDFSNFRNKKGEKKCAIESY